MLAFDTATRATTVALCGPDGTIEARDDPPRGDRPTHATKLMPLVAEVLERSGHGFEDLERIVVGRGPGTFTGLRIGIATARGLSRGAGIPLVGVSTLQSLALGAESQPERADADAVLAVLDARRGEVFAAAWRDALDAADPALLSAGAYAPEALAGAIGALGLRVLAVGEGAVEFRSVLERSGAFIPPDDSELHRTAAGNHCRLARDLRGSAPDEVLPDYLRLPDAEITRRAAPSQ